MLGKEVTIPKLKKSQSADQWVPTPEDIKKVDDYINSISDPARKPFMSALFDGLRYTGARMGSF